MKVLSLETGSHDGIVFVRTDLVVRSEYAPLEYADEGKGGYVVLTWINPEAGSAVALMMSAGNEIEDYADMIVDRIYRDLIDGFGVAWRGCTWAGRSSNGAVDQYAIEDWPDDGTWYPLLSVMPCHDRTLSGFVRLADSVGIPLTWHRDGVLGRTARQVDSILGRTSRTAALGTNMGDL